MVKKSILIVVVIPAKTTFVKALSVKTAIEPLLRLEVAFSHSECHSEKSFTNFLQLATIFIRLR